ncbi:hypothetical protein PF010_g12242 [Phytophthora fragariae]|uniref:Integrase catalytic domain-containing protein n=2 Tax=Phytophthora fragariae TaxID=53985 RepID=A0A6G0L487_9STRA|nr:hypothetical protein PF010_g12242 [Phytophthora fragariae]
MSPTPLGPNDVLRDENYFLWEFNARITLARKDLLNYVVLKPEEAALRSTAAWEAADLQALAVLVKLLGPTYQSMVRESSSAIQAWETLRGFFVKQNLHNRVQLRKQLHEFEMSTGDDLMQHLMQFDELCLRLSAVGDVVAEDERLVILLGSLPQDYDGMVKIIEAHGNMTLLEAKEMLRREYETIQKREKHEAAFHASAGDVQGRDGHSDGRQGRRGRRQHGRGRQHGRDGVQGRGGQTNGSAFNGRCFLCKEYGHKRAQCPKADGTDEQDEYAFAASAEVSTAWILDSGASSHMTMDRSDFSDFAELSGPLEVCVASGHRLPARGVGTVRVLSSDGVTVKMTKVLYVPLLDRKLISIPALASKGMVVLFDGDGCSIQYQGKVVSHIRKHGAMYAWDVQVLKEAQGIEIAAVATSQADASVWHARLGHISLPRMRDVVRIVDGVPNLASQQALAGACEGCACGKMSVTPFFHRSASQVKTQRILEVVHSDVMGPMNPKSKGGARFVVTFIDDYSRYVSVYMLKSKAEVLKYFDNFRQLAETQTGSTLKCLRTDNGGEYVSKRFNQFCANHGIVHQTTTPYTPQQNGLAERMNRTIVERARSMLYYQQVDKCWWAEAVMTAVYITNRIPNTARGDLTPYEVFWGKKPWLDHLRVFGSRGFMHIDKSIRTKWDSKAHKIMLLGYADNAKAYRVWDFDASRVATARTINVDERPPSTIQTLGVSNRLPEVLQFPDDLSVDENGHDPRPAAPNGTGNVDVDADIHDSISMVTPMDVDQDASVAPDGLMPIANDAGNASMVVDRSRSQVPSSNNSTDVVQVQGAAPLLELPTSQSSRFSGEGESQLVFQGTRRSPVFGRGMIPQFLPSVELPNQERLASHLQNPRTPICNSPLYRFRHMVPHRAMRREVMLAVMTSVSRIPSALVLMTTR